MSSTKQSEKFNFLALLRILIKDEDFYFKETVDKVDLWIMWISL
jgi:hypothetical protein